MASATAAAAAGAPFATETDVDMEDAGLAASAAAGTAAAAPTEWVCPGDRLGLAAELVAGKGCYVRGDHVVASIVGVKQCTFDDSVSKLRVAVDAPATTAVTVPVVNSIVTAKVTRINAALANVDILCLGETPLQQAFSGIIRKEYVRSVEIDRVEMQESFRPGDVVKARVVSLGDARSYYLSTAEDELGVVFALSAAGTPMVPISWQEMECPATGAREHRKVAKLANVAAEPAK